MANDLRLLTRLMLAWWKLEHKDKRIYVNGIRVHHGEVGLALKKLGKWLNVSELIQIGDELIRDDTADRREWLSFKTYEQELKEARRKRLNAVHTYL